MARVTQDVVFVDGVRTPFGKAGSALAAAPRRRASGALQATGGGWRAL